ncbi:MAG: PD-(D/E)XK nuclease family protein [Synergistaceae bacterium]|nr:PD-(D/E)XK nuclease family protein [Synergistaceae bacterium]
MSVTCYANVSDLAVCQRCPALFAYVVYMKKKSAWRVGIHGGKEAYGSVFHKEISEKFFEAASDERNPLNKEIGVAASKGADVLEEFMRKNIFMPFVETKSKYFTSGQILSIAKATQIFAYRIAKFLKNSRPVFMKPEGKLKGSYFSVSHNAELIITGRYDALIFNKALGEARLFEFKGFKKSDITVPLSQSLLYSWLIEKTSGIVPSIEIIYLNESRPEVFTSEVVREMMISGLPGLFNWALDIILLRRMPEMLHDKNLCEKCKFSTTCEKDMQKIFAPIVNKKRRGASMLSLLVFFFAAAMVTAQVFFFSNITAGSVKDDREILGIRMELANLVEIARNTIVNKKSEVEVIGTLSADYEKFFDTTRKDREKYEKNFYKTADDKTCVNVHDLNYKFVNGFDDKKFSEQEPYKKIFPPIPDHFLIRAYTEVSDKRYLMFQVLVDSTGEIKTYEEIWYNTEK